MTEKKMITNGKRFDGRTLDQMRPFEAKAGVVKNADGSGFFKIGNTSAVAAVYGPRQMHPRHSQNPAKGTLRCRYNMVPFSTTERIRPGPSRRSNEISKVIRGSFEESVFLEEYPKSVIDVFIDITGADASTRCAAINAASIALADAGIPMRDLIASCAAGKVEDQVILDVAGKEDTEGEVDLPIAYSPRSGKITLLQMDGIISHDDFNQAIDLAIKGCKEIHKAQQTALKEKFKGAQVEE